jgi:hypothetical protein
MLFAHYSDAQRNYSEVGTLGALHKPEGVSVPVMSMHDDVAELRIAPDHDAFLVTCSSRPLLSRLADKWVTLVLCALMDGSTRHSVLSRRITGVSQKC